MGNNARPVTDHSTVSIRIANVITHAAQFPSRMEIACPNIPANRGNKNRFKYCSNSLYYFSAVFARICDKIYIIISSGNYKTVCNTL